MSFARLKPEHSILAFILIMGVILRVLNISDYDMQIEEQHTLSQMMSENSDELFLVNPQTERYTPVYEIGVKFYTVMAGLSLVNMRIPSIIAGVVAIGLIYVLGSRLYSRETGLVSAAILGFIWPAIEVSRTAGPEIFLLMMVLVCGLIFWRILEQTTRRTGPELSTWLGFTLALTLLSYSHQVGVFAALTMVVIAAGYAAGIKRALVPALLSLTLLLILCAPLSLMLTEILFAERTPSVLLSEMFFTTSDTAIFIQSWLFLLTGIGATGLSVYALMRPDAPDFTDFQQTRHAVDLMLGGWILLSTIAGLIAALFNVPVAAEQLFMLFIPAVILLWSRLVQMVTVNIPAFLRVGLGVAFIMMLHTIWQLMRG